MKYGLRERIFGMRKLAMCVLFTWLLYRFDRNRVMQIVVRSDNLSDALTGILTFTTLILGFVNVLLPAIISMKKESDLISKFFRHISTKCFSDFIRNNILVGLCLIICTVIMFFVNDFQKSNCEKIAIIVSWTTLFFWIYFIVTTFDVLNSLLRLLIEDCEGEAYPKG
nr:hypothetical protein [uncultured Agathobaculum sp.]